MPMNPTLLGTEIKNAVQVAQTGATTAPGTIV